MHDDPAYLRSVLAAGSSGYVLKRSVDGDLLAAIRAVHRGGTFVDPSLAEVLVQDALGKEDSKARRTRPVNILSDRELQVLRLVARGYSSQQIANQILVGVMLDVGANRDSLLKDPMYIGNRHARVRGKRYDNFIDAYVKTATKRFPNAMLQWADFEPGNGRRILEKYRDRICTFNDEMQGAGAITLAAAISAVRVLGSRLGNQRVVIFGAGGPLAWCRRRERRPF